MTGTAYGIGVGPGDPELITVKGLRLLRACPVLAYPAPQQGDSLARRIVAPHLAGNQTEIAIRMPLTVERFPAPEVYDRASAELGAHLAAGRDAAILCLGDPFFYGSFIYLFARLAAAHKVIVVPGVTSVAAAAAAAGVPLVAGSDTLAVIPASLPDAEIERRLAICDAAAIVKLGRHFARIRSLLERLQLIDRTRYVEHATMADERQMALRDAAPESAPYFSLLLTRRGGIP